MATEKPASVEHEVLVVEQSAPVHDDSVADLLSMENLDRSSPEMWPEKSPVPGMSEFLHSYSQPRPTTQQLYSKEMNQDDKKYFDHLAKLSPQDLIQKLKELQDSAYQLGIEESKEMTRGKLLNIFKSREKQQK